MMIFKQNVELIVPFVGVTFPANQTITSNMKRTFKNQTSYIKQLKPPPQPQGKNNMAEIVDTALRRKSDGLEVPPHALHFVPFVRVTILAYQNITSN